MLKVKHPGRRYWYRIRSRCRCVRIHEPSRTTFESSGLEISRSRPALPWHDHGCWQAQQVHGQVRLATLTLRSQPVDFDQSGSTDTVIAPAIVASLERVRSGCPAGSQMPLSCPTDRRRVSSPSCSLATRQTTAGSARSVDGLYDEHLAALQKEGLIK